MPIMRKLNKNPCWLAFKPDVCWESGFVTAKAKGRTFAGNCCNNGVFDGAVFDEAVLCVGKKKASIMPPALMVGKVLKAVTDGVKTGVVAP